jgi:stage II sporulation protein D
MRVWLALLAVLAFPGLAHGGTVFLLDGRGWGHGVGMSQWGAEGYARHGYGYRQILAHYYPHTHIAPTRPSDVRVLLQENQLMFRVGSSAPFLVVDARGEKVHLSPRAVVVRRDFKQLVFPLRFEPGVQPLRLGGAGYRGAIVVNVKPGGLMAVNVLPLDRYLRGVVPWEAPVGWHTQTYEAQAVAARSYTLAMLKPGEDFDLYPDDLSQMYGGIKAERTETNLAIGATAGQVLEFGDTIIPAYYFSTSGGRTSSIHDAWPRMKQVPYLVSVADPYDYISPHHVWPTAVLTPARVAAELHVGVVRDLRVVHNSSGRAEAVRALTTSGWKQFPGQMIRTKFKLGSTDFDIHAMTLDSVPGRLVYGNHVRVQGWVRGLGKARLQELTGAGWQTVHHIQPAPSGRFAVSILALRSTEYRLAYNGVAGDAVPVQVVPRVSLSAQGGDLHALVSPSLPMQVQRLTNSRWHLVASSRGVFNRTLRPGSYRVEVPGGTAYASTVTRPVALRAQSTSP